MTYALAAALQSALYSRLTNDPELQALVGDAIHDAVPAGTPQGTFVLLGPEEVTDRSDATGAGAEHRVKIVVVTASAGFALAKKVAGRICDCLAEAPIAIERGRVVGVWFQRATATKSAQGGTRRVELWFRVRLSD